MEPLSGGRWIRYEGVRHTFMYSMAHLFIGEGDNPVPVYEVRFFLNTIVVLDGFNDVTYEVLEPLGELYDKPNYPDWLQEIIDEQLPIATLMLKGE